MQSEYADPLGSPNRGCTMYAVLIYNQRVRADVKENRPQHILSERWAEEQMHEVCADSEADARRIASDRFPESEGFVITRIERAPMH